MTDVRGWYRETYKDRFFNDEGGSPAWFWWFVGMELVGHVPVCVGVLARGGVGGEFIIFLSDAKYH